MIASYSWSSVPEFILLTFSRPEINKSSLVALTLRLLAVLSCLYLVVHGKPASLCCQRRLKLADRVHDGRAEVTGTTRHWIYWKVLLQNLTYKPQNSPKKGNLALVTEHPHRVISLRRNELTPVRPRPGNLVRDWNKRVTNFRKTLKMAWWI